ncbi:hypothetical protein N9N97_01550 [Rickettsiaceae bacterium]|nr:hypothetical protein [Rickettsiaceae bacterium]
MSIDNTEQIYEQIRKTKHANHNQEELYNSILEDIREMYSNKLPEMELHQATRNFIEFVRELLKHG